MSELLHHPLWAEIAFRELLLNVREIPGPEAHWRILEYFRATGLEPSDGDETPWCAVGLNYALLMASIRGTGKANARSFLEWGAPCELRRGAIAVLWRVSRIDWRGHVGIVSGWGDGRIALLGANQGNTWSIQFYESGRLLGMRWPRAEELLQ